MPNADNSLVAWKAPDTFEIPAQASIKDLVEYATPQLSIRDKKSIVSAFEAESYEMVATFVWTKAAAALKRQVASLGMEFVGEMLGRPGLTDDSDPSILGDHEAIALAEDLGMLNSTQALRLSNALKLVNHFANLDRDTADSEAMDVDEARSILKNCIASILREPHSEGALHFKDLRRALGERQLTTGDGLVTTLLNSPYFFMRTTLSALLSLVKTAKGSVKEHAIGNAVVIVPAAWQNIRAPERWQIGQSYAEVSAEGDRAAANGLKKALLQVHGFDFVPESLRSNTFAEAAVRVLSAHFAMNNFYNEEEPMSVLANLGTAIPKPAFAKCMEATLAVRLGNPWGRSWAAGPHADAVLNTLRAEQWEYYLNECMRRDRTILDKLEDEKPTAQWIAVVKSRDLTKLSITHRPVRDLIRASQDSDRAKILNIARTLRTQVTS